MAAALVSEHVTTFGYLFYASTPNASSFEYKHEVPDYVLAVVPQFIILLLLEIITLHYRGKVLPPVGDFITSVGHGVLYTTINALTAGVELVFYQWMFDRRFLTLDWASPLTWWTAAIGVDLAYYFIHRTVHEVAIGWAVHQVHHSSEEYNLSTALRQSIFQKFFSIGFHLPLALIGVPLPILLVHLQFNLLYQFWIHTEAVSNIGPLEYILNTASHHRVHHGSNHWCVDKNFAGVLIIWDRMFGTFQAEIDDEPITYGLLEQPQTLNVPYLQVFYMRDTLKRAWAQSSWGNTVRSLVLGPGWVEGSPRLGFPLPKEPLPPRKKYQPFLPRHVEAYLVGHFFMCLVIQQQLLRNFDSYSWVASLSHVVFLVASIGNIGAMYDGWRLAGAFEVVRCLAYVVVTSRHPLTMYPLLNTALHAYTVFSVIFWSTHTLLHSSSGKTKLT